MEAKSVMHWHSLRQPQPLRLKCFPNSSILSSLHFERGNTLSALYVLFPRFQREFQIPILSGIHKTSCFYHIWPSSLRCDPVGPLHKTLNFSNGNAIKPSKHLNCSWLSRTQSSGGDISEYRAVFTFHSVWLSEAIGSSFYIIPTHLPIHHLSFILLLYLVKELAVSKYIVFRFVIDTCLKHPFARSIKACHKNRDHA